MPLQAADLVAWFVRQRWIEHGTTLASEALAFPWPAKREMKFFGVEYDEEGLRKTLEETRPWTIEYEFRVTEDGQIEHLLSPLYQRPVSDEEALSFFERNADGSWTSIGQSLLRGLRSTVSPYVRGPSSNRAKYLWVPMSRSGLNV